MHINLHNNRASDASHYCNLPPSPPINSHCQTQNLPTQSAKATSTNSQGSPTVCVSVREREGFIVSEQLIYATEEEEPIGCESGHRFPIRILWMLLLRLWLLWAGLMINSAPLPISAASLPAFCCSSFITLLNWFLISLFLYTRKFPPFSATSNCFLCLPIWFPLLLEFPGIWFSEFRSECESERDRFCGCRLMELKYGGDSLPGEFYDGEHWIQSFIF